MIFPLLASTLQLLFIRVSAASPAVEYASPFEDTSSFINPKISSSAGGHATCLSGHLSIPITTTSNTKLLFPEPIDQYAVTDAFAQYLRANSTQAATINGGPLTISQTFSIAARLCYPKNVPSDSFGTIQFLTHGISFNQSYWDFAEGYSFVDAAALAGYPTFSHDRLGTGDSDHPDGIQIVQAGIQVEIIHSLVSFLREGKIAGQNFKNVIGVEHSYGSIEHIGIAATPLVLTGFSMNSSTLPLQFGIFNSAIARENQPDRKTFRVLGNGYLVIDNAKADQMAHWSWPNFDPEIFQRATTYKETFTFGEFFTLSSVIAVSPDFTGPVDTVIGENDLPFARGNAYYPTDQAAKVQPALFPNASNGSRGFVQKGAGHAITLHHSAQDGFDHVREFVKDNGF